MKILLFIAILFLINVFFSGCKKTTNAMIIYSEYASFDSLKRNKKNADTFIFNNGRYLVKISYDTIRNLDRIDGTLFGRPYGHSFKMDILGRFFHENTEGNLTSYKYLSGDGLHFSYEVKFNFQSKEYKETGGPLVDYVNNESKYKDSLKFTLNFSTFPRKNLDVLYSLDEKNYYKLNLVKSKLMPYLYEADIVVEKKQHNIFVKTEANGLVFSLYNLPDEKTFRDTLSLPDFSSGIMPTNTRSPLFTP